MKNKTSRILLIFLVSLMGNSIFAEAKLLPDFNPETVDWGTHRYKITLIKNEEKIEMGSVTFRNKLTGNRVILTDEYQFSIEAIPMSLNMTQVCLKDKYLSPVRIDCKGKGSDEFETFKATIKDGQAKIEGQRRNGMMKIPQNGGGIREQLFWVTEEGILQRILMDGRKQIDLQTG